MQAKESHTTAIAAREAAECAAKEIRTLAFGLCEDALDDEATPDENSLDLFEDDVVTQILKHSPVSDVPEHLKFNIHHEGEFAVDDVAGVGDLAPDVISREAAIQVLQDARAGEIDSDLRCIIAYLRDLPAVQRVAAGGWLPIAEMSERDELEQDFKNADYKYAYVEDHVDCEIAIQIRSLRKKAGLTQKQLAEIVGTKQPGIDRVEDVNYRGWKLETLKKYARALNTHLVVKFVSEEEILDEISGVTAGGEAMRRACIEKIEELSAEWERLGDYGINAGYVAKIRTANEIAAALETVEVKTSDAARG